MESAMENAADKKFLADHFGDLSSSRWYTSSRTLSRVMAAVLRLMHGPVESKLLGLEYLNQVVENVACTLQNGGYLDVAFDSLLKMISIKDTKLLSPAYAALRNLLKVIDLCDHTAGPSTKFGQLAKSDTLLIETLRNLELFAEREIRTILVDETVLLMDYIGFPCGKCLPRFLSLTDSLISMQVLWQYTLALKLFRSIFKHCWPVCANHINRLVLQLMKILLDEGVEEGTTIYQDTCHMLFLCMSAGNSCQISEFIRDVLTKGEFSLSLVDKLNRAMVFL